MINIFVICIGNEILLGKTINTNLATLAEMLYSKGYKIAESCTIKDKPDLIKNKIKRAWSQYDVVISIGGLGPTQDDLTRKSIAESFSKTLKTNNELWEKIKNKREDIAKDAQEILKTLAEVPKDFKSMPNKVGTAPGLHYDKTKKHFFALPGVPEEMKSIVKESVIPILENSLPAQKRYLKTIRTAAIREVDLHEKLKNIKITANSSLAFLPKPGLVDIRIESSKKEEFIKLFNKIQPLIKEHIYGYDDDTIQEKCHKKLIKNKKTVSAAESCTGGLIQNYLTDNAGSSEYYLGGFVTYSNFAKNKFLSVKNSTLDKYGAVSEETVKEMLKGAKNQFNSDISIAVSGIAGPTGGTEGKPVGLVYVGVLIDDNLIIDKCNFSGNRLEIKKQSAVKAFFLLLKNI